MSEIRILIRFLLAWMRGGRFDRMGAGKFNLTEEFDGVSDFKLENKCERGLI
jgi:hypothetical protein